MTARFWMLLGVIMVAGIVLLIGGATVAQEGIGTLPAQPTPERFWSDNICPQDVTAPPVTCTFLRTEGSTVRVPLVDPTGYTYGMILIDAGHVTFVQATATIAATTPTPAPSQPPVQPTATPRLADLNTATADEIALLPGDTYGQPLGIYVANSIVRYRPYATLEDLSRAPGVFPETIAALRACQCVASPR